jgi:UDP-N-acetylmuramyl pentapeptide synthase
MNIIEFKEVIKNHIILTYNYLPELELLSVEDFCWNSRDTNKVIFFAIRGLKEDGNKYIEDAIKNGFLIIISDNKEYIEDIKKRFKNIYFIIVDNIQETFNTLGKFGISKFKGEKFAITGSVGKTTSTYLLNNILKNFYKIICTNKYNSQYFLRKLCFQLYNNIEEDLLITELSSDKFGTIDNYGNIIKPHYSIITAIGNAHIEDLKSFENIIKEKTSLINHTQYKTFIPFEYKKIIENEENIIKNKNKIIYVNNDFIIKQEGIVFHVNGNEILISNPNLKGEYNYSNINLVLHLIFQAHMYLLTNQDNINKITKTIENICPFPGRGNIININKKDFNFNIICEYHNASPLSFTETIKNIKKPTIVLMGYMYSLGSETKDKHEELLNLMEENPHILNIILCDKKIYEIGFILNKYKKLLPAYEDVLYDILTNKQYVNNIFIKGSRSSQLENFLKKILDFCE